MGFTTTYIDVSFDWVGYHCWPGAEGKHAYLSHTHRHHFEGEASIEVKHDDRELEFMAVLDYINSMLPQYEQAGSMSCEAIAKEILEGLTGMYGEDRNMTVGVYEDGENGAFIVWTADELDP